MQATTTTGIHENSELDKDLLLSIIVAGIVLLFLSTNTIPALIKPVLVDGSIISNGRFAITYDGYETIAEDDVVTVVGIGSSILMAAMDGRCMEEKTEITDARFYNFAMSGAYPYSEMIQVPALIEANPDVVLVEIGPNSLWGWTDDLWSGTAEYNEFRFKLMSMTMSPRHVGGWYYILENDDQKYINDGSAENIDAWNEYTNEALEEYLRREIDEVSNMLDSTSYSYVPKIGTNEWDSYLSQPNWRESKFDEKGHEETREYLDEVMESKSKQGVYNPKSSGTQNHMALDYTIHELLNASIEVVLIGIPHHPWVNSYLEAGQLDGMNETYRRYSALNHVTPIQMYWDEWPTDAFSDRNHLDSEGREIFCENVTPIVDTLMGYGV